MEARDELIKARVRLQDENPFFSWLVMGLNLQEDTSGRVDTCAVDTRGNLIYNPKFIEKLTQNQIKTLLSHEVLHIALQHLIRVRVVVPDLDEKKGIDSKTKAKLELWNIATDLVINNSLVENNFEFSGLLNNGLVPRNNEFLFKGDGFRIKNIDEKIAEEIYHELYDKVKKTIENYKGFDIHIYDGKTPIEELEKDSKAWKQRLVEAEIYAKMKGKEPKGLGRYIDKLLNPKLNWRELLYRYITQEIPTDYNWNMPSKRSQVLGVYLPRIKKELIDITIAIDTSGSIGKEELTEFLSEVIGIAKAFESLRINILFMDAQIHNHYVLDQSNYEDVLTYDIGGGGGTDFTDIYKYIEENVPNTRLLVFFTDGFATFPREEEKKTLWVLTKNSCDVSSIPFGEIVKIEK